MIKSVLLILIVMLLLYGIKYVRNLPPAKRKQVMIKALLYSGAGIIILLIVTGRLHWLAAGVAAILPVAQRLFFTAMRFMPYLRFWQNARNQQQQSSQNPRSRGKMSVKEAQEVLGLETLDSAEQVTKRHKEMMQKMHPDRGGSDYLAAQINQAKETLIKHLKA